MRLILGIFLFLFFFVAGGFGVYYLLQNQEPVEQAPQSTAEQNPSTDTPTQPIKIEEPKETKDPNIIELFNGETLEGWASTQFGGEGTVSITEEGALEFDYGEVMTGVNWQGDPPRTSNYEISLEAKRLDGSDFFCALTFPVKNSHASLIVGGWGGSVVGISSIDGLDASENETLKIEGFETDVWYRIRLRVTDKSIEAWIDDEQKINVNIANREVSLRPGAIEISVPIGIASYQCSAQFRKIIWKNLSE